MGRTLCKFLAHRQILPRHYIRNCAEPVCTWDDWQHGLTNLSTIPSSLTVNNSAAFLAANPSHKYRIVLSYGHNGFGNQLWQHSVAFMIASNMKARFIVAMIPDQLSPGGYLPPNTMAGMSAMERLLPDDFEYEALPADSYIRHLCDQETFYIADRPVDWRDRNYSTNFRHNLHTLLADPRPRCLKLIGYFQNLPLCDDDVRNLWTDRLLGNFTLRPGENDLSIYLRCLPRHYHFNDKHFYETILNNTHFDHIWLFMAPECPTKLSNNPAKDGAVAAVVRLLTERYNATRWHQYPGADDTTALLHDLAGLTSSKKLILPLSSWAFWAGLLSNASEIHVNSPPLHPLMDTRPQYIYHSDRGNAYFGSSIAAETRTTDRFGPHSLYLYLPGSQQ
eukprot:gene10640-11588_t